MMRMTALTLLLSAAVLGQPPSSQKIEREGIAVEFEMENLDEAKQAKGLFQEGDAVRIRFRISDTATETPLSAVYPGGWMDLLPEGESRELKSCRGKIEAFMSGSLLSPPELDLNVYYVLALNDDATISVVDPLFGFGTTKLLSMIRLPSPGEDWALSPDHSKLFVSLPRNNRVAVADTGRWKITRQIDVGPNPSRLALQPDGKYLWATFDKPRVSNGESGVSVIDVESLRHLADIETGRGGHELAFSQDDRFAFVTNHDDGTLSVIDIAQLKVTAQVEVGGNPVSLDYSSFAQTVYVSDSRGSIAAVDARNHTLTTQIKAEEGLSQIRFAPGGRYAFALNTPRNLLHIIDASQHRIVQTGDMLRGPDQVAFTQGLAYIRHSGSEIVFMIPLSQIGREGAPVPSIDFPGGQHAFGAGAKPSPAGSLVQAPGATAMLVANPADKMIYYYKEGMAAPMGSFKNYGRQPRAVLVVDHSLSETRAGVYETVTQLRRPGEYDLAFFLDSPRILHCFPLQVEANPQLQLQRRARKPVDITPQIESRSLSVGKQASLRFRLGDPLSGELRRSVSDLNVLVFLAPGTWEKRQWAQEVEPGHYQVAFTPPRPGVYYVFLASRSQGLEFNQSPFLILYAHAGTKAEQAQPASGTRSDSAQEENHHD